MSKTVKTNAFIAKNERLEEINIFEKRYRKPEELSRLAQKRKIEFLYKLRVSKRIDAVIELGVNSLLFAAITIPVFIFLILRKILIFKPVFYKETIYGQFGFPLKLRFFNFQNRIMAGCSLFWYVFSGKLGLAGPGIRSYNPANREYGDSFIFNARPGIFTLWYVRNAGGIAYASRRKVDEEYYYNRCFWSDIALIIKTVITFFFSSKVEKASPRINLFDVTFHNLTMRDAVRIIQKTVNSETKKMFFFVNPDCFNKTFKDKEYLKILQRTPDIFPDGIGVKIACKMIHSPIIENVNGTDMLPFLCDTAVHNQMTIYLLGGKPGIAERMRNNLLVRYSRLKIVGFQHGYFNHETDSPKVIDCINRSRADILLVAFGVPAQEKWIAKHFDEINCKAIIGVGGLFDFYSDNIRRAPKWIREIGMEWSFRLAMEPRRMFKRYIIGNPLFLWRVLRWRRKIQYQKEQQQAAKQRKESK